MRFSKKHAELFKTKKKDVTSRQKYMLVDFSQIAWASFHTQVKNDHQLRGFAEKKAFWKYIMFNMILKSKNLFKPNQTIMCADSRSWRKEVFEFYKANRVSSGEKTDPVLQDFFETIDEFIQELRMSFPFLVIHEYGAEADDIIAILTQRLQPNEVIIISGDKDFQQLLKYKNTKLYSPIKKEEIKCPDPILQLQHLIMLGDKSDGIPNIMSDDDTYVNEKKKTVRFGPKKVEKILESGLDKWFAENPNASVNYDRNKKLIDLNITNIPREVVDKVMTSFDEFKNKNGFMQVLQYLSKHKMRSLQDRVNEFF